MYFRNLLAFNFLIKAKVIFKIHSWLGNSQTIKYLFRGPRNQ